MQNFQKIIDFLLRKHQIKVVKWSRSSCGRAWVLKREVKIPKATNKDRFCVALHEIGHIVKNARKKTLGLWKSEWLAEQYVFQTAEKFGIDISEYRERSRRYLVMNVAKGHCRGLNLDTLPADFQEFCRVDFKLWKNKKVFVKNWGVKSYSSPLVIEVQ